jgi:hypothetical protein
MIVYKKNDEKGFKPLSEMMFDDMWYNKEKKKKNLTYCKLCNMIHARGFELVNSDDWGFHAFHTVWYFGQLLVYNVVHHTAIDFLKIFLNLCLAASSQTKLSNRLGSRVTITFLVSRSKEFNPYPCAVRPPRTLALSWWAVSGW